MNTMRAERFYSKFYFHAKLFCCKSFGKSFLLSTDRIRLNLVNEDGEIEAIKRVYFLILLFRTLQYG